MSKVIIMGMIFESGEEPDFGSIYRCCERQNGVHDYGLNAEDVEKLDLITNVAPGSTALCDDTADIYRLTKSGEWQKFGEDAVSTRSVQSAPTVAPLSLGKTVAEPENDFNFGDISFEEKEGPSEEKESLEIEKEAPTKEVK